MPINFDELFSPLMSGAIAGAGLTLTSGKFVIDYMERKILNNIGEPLDDLISLKDPINRVIRETFVIVLLFLTSSILHIIYCFAGPANPYSYLFFNGSYTAFSIGVLMLFHFGWSCATWDI